GVRDFHVTGVQTCALPIYRRASSAAIHDLRVAYARRHADGSPAVGGRHLRRARDAADVAAANAREPMEDRTMSSVLFDVPGPLRSEEPRVGNSGSVRTAK